MGVRAELVPDPGSTDPDSTALVRLALLALGVSPTTVTRSGAGGVASLLGANVASGPGAREHGRRGASL